MALDKELLNDYKKAGSIISQAIPVGKKLVQVDANVLDVCQKIESKIRKLGGEVAFPAQTSIDHVAAHWCPDPDDETVFEEGQLVKLDIGCHIEGAIADTAVSIDLSDDGRHEVLIKTAEQARDEALKMMTPGTQLGAIGRRIQDTITEAGFSPVRNLCGHGLAPFEVHTPPTIPNIDTGDTTELEEGMICAVEPFATNGRGQVQELDKGNIFSLDFTPRVRSNFTRQALKLIDGYDELPFTTHWLAKKMGSGPARFAMRELTQIDAVEEYPPLIEMDRGIVSQAEHSVIVGDKPTVYTKG